MKNNFVKGLSLSLLLISASCRKPLSEFLDKAPGVDVTEDIVFSKRANVEAYVSTLYQYGMVSIFPNRDVAVISNPANGSNSLLTGTLSGATDESENSAAFTYLQKWNQAEFNAATITRDEDSRYFGRWKAIRIACILLERVDEVPDADATYKTQVKGEAKFMRALQNFETLKRYGGFPIVTKRYKNLDEAKVPRGTIEECVNAIVKDCDEAAASLPVSYPAAMRGRATRLVALALKSRTLLYAASPLFNTPTPFLSMPNAADNKLICYGNFDPNRWKLAADAAKAVLDEASAAGVALIDVPANRDPTVANVANGNYRVAWERQDNTEIILADKTYGAQGRFTHPWYSIVPPVYNSFFSGNSVTFNHQKKYEVKSTGLPQTWEATGGTDLLAKYNQLDPRFKQSINYVTSRWSATYPIAETWQGGAHVANNPGGAWMKKHFPDAAENQNQPPSIALYRLNEFYLNYAEAQNEFAGPDVSASVGTPLTPREAVNIIRTRSAMPNIAAGLSQSAFRTRVRNERDIELAFEDHRFWDIRRWLIAEQEGVMTGAMYGLRITRTGTSPNFLYSWEPFVFETRTFSKRMYLHPYDRSEVLKGNLMQNPGWE